jgi:bacillolysin
VFGSLNDSNKEIVRLVSLGADKITPVANSKRDLYTNGKWPVWYSNAARALPTKTAQTINFAAIPNRFLADGNLTLTATSSAGLRVGFSVQSGPAELVSANQVRFTGTGAVVIRAFQEGNSSVYVATPVDRTFEVQTPLATEPDWAGQVRVYPNPARSRLNVELPQGIGWQTAELVSGSGTVLQQHRATTPAPTLQLDMGTLPTGLYFLNIDTTDGRVLKKVVRE